MRSHLDSGPMPFVFDSKTQALGALHIGEGRGRSQNQHNIRRGFVEYIRCTSACTKSKHINVLPKSPDQSTFIKTLKTAVSSYALVFPKTDGPEMSCSSLRKDIRLVHVRAIYQRSKRVDLRVWIVDLCLDIMHAIGLCDDTEMWMHGTLQIIYEDESEVYLSAYQSINSDGWQYMIC